MLSCLCCWHRCDVPLSHCNDVIGRPRNPVSRSIIGFGFRSSWAIVWVQCYYYRPLILTCEYRYNTVSFLQNIHNISHASEKKSFVLTYLTLSPIDAYVLQSSNSYAIIDSDNDLSIVRYQVIVWTNIGLLLIGAQRTRFCELWITAQQFSYQKINLKTVHKMSASWLLLPLQWHHDGRDGVSNHQPHHFVLNGLFRRRSKEPSKLRITGLCAGNSPETGEFPAQVASNAENVSIWWRHHVATWNDDSKSSGKWWVTKPIFSVRWISF